MSVLNVAKVRTGFGQQEILHGVDLAVEDGSVTGIFGLNGAGKSVLLKTIAGVVPAWAGRVELHGQDITRLLPEKRVALGLAHVPQGRQVFPSLSVEQNLRIGGYTLRRRDKREYERNLDHVYAVFPRLAERRRQAAGTLSGGEQAMLAVGRALVNSPKLVLVDEPSAGLAPAVVDTLLETLLQVRQTGLPMLVVEQNIRFGLKLCDHAYLLQKGRVVYSGATDELDQDRLASYLGVGRLLSGDLTSGLNKKKRTRRPRPAPSPA